MSRERRWRLAAERISAVAGAVALLAVLSACLETDVNNELRIRNMTTAPIDVEYEMHSGERVRIISDLGLQDESLALPPNDPDVEGGGYKCTEGPLIVLQDGEEIERFDPPVCYGDGLTLTVDGESR